MRPLTILLLLVAVVAGLFAGLFNEPLAILASRLLSCAAFVASMITFALGLPRKPGAAELPSDSPSRHSSGSPSLSALG